jgi:electron transfer flavoprotein alpha subunit
VSTTADSMAAPGALLLVLEPGGENASPAGAGLTAEGARLATELGVEPHLVTWEGRPDLDSEALAATLAEAAGRAPAVAVLFVDTDLGRELAPMVAHRLGSGAVIGCSDVLVRDGGLVFVKPVYGGWLEQEIEPLPGTVPVVTLDLAGMPAPESPAEALHAPDVLEIEGVTTSAVRSLERIPPDARTVDLVHAKRIVAAGSGSAGDALLEAARDLADLLEGSVGATRPVVDDGRLPKERLIGQTGRTVTPELYVALGISGSPHHMAGVRKAGKILSIDRDVRAPIFQFSDVGYIADLEDVLPALVQKIKEYRDAPGSAE